VRRERPGGGRAHGAVTRGWIVDVTEMKRLESHLVRIQSMDAIGRLAGGIAHDVARCCPRSSATWKRGSRRGAPLGTARPGVSAPPGERPDQ
jgi:hypothetical protein